MRDPETVYAENRAAYDAVAVDYARLTESLLDALPWDRAVLDAFAAHVHDAGGGPVLDVGCGPGRIAAYLRDRGLDVAGTDLSPGMVAEARRRHPQIAFDTGRLDAIDVPDASRAGVVVWYALIHVPPAERPSVLAECVRVLRRGGLLQLAFQVGTEHRTLTAAYGHDVVIEVWRLDPTEVTAELASVGLDVVASVRRAPTGHETLDQAYLLARKQSA